MSNNHSQKYTDDELRAKAICTLTALNQGNPLATQLVIAMSHIMRMHPNQVIDEIEKLSTIKV